MRTLISSRRLLGLESYRESTSKICRLGDASGSKTIVVMGDSHAQMWMPAILQMAEQDSWAVLPVVKSACTPNTTWTNRGDFAIDGTRLDARCVYAVRGLAGHCDRSRRYVQTSR